MSHIIQPAFEIDDKGRTICKSHSYYQFFTIPNKTPYQEKQVEKLLTCKTCDHYNKNNCFFPKREIDLIERERMELKFKCQLCGSKIHRLLSIIQSLYYETKYNVDIPSICCDCYANLNDNTFLQKSKLRSIIFIASLLTAIYFVFNYFIALFSTIWILFIWFIIPLSFWAYISIRDIKKLWYLKEGRKYYKKFFKKQRDEINEDIFDDPDLS